MYNAIIGMSYNSPTRSCGPCGGACDQWADSAGGAETPQECSTLADGQESAYTTYPRARFELQAPAGPRLKTQSQEQRGPLRLDFIATHTHRRGRDSKIGQPVEEEGELSSS